MGNIPRPCSSWNWRLCGVQVQDSGKATILFDFVLTNISACLLASRAVSFHQKAEASETKHLTNHAP